MGLPPKNNLIPKDLSILPEDPLYSDDPQLLKKWGDSELWYKKDDKFKMPKGIVQLKLYTSDLGFG
jgi:secreted Zn-dependent insulinase-like peptidase